MGKRLLSPTCAQVTALLFTQNAVQGALERWMQRTGKPEGTAAVLEDETGPTTFLWATSNGHVNSAKQLLKSDSTRSPRETKAENEKTRRYDIGVTGRLLYSGTRISSKRCTRVTAFPFMRSPLKEEQKKSEGTGSEKTDGKGNTTGTAQDKRPCSQRKNAVP